MRPATHVLTLTTYASLDGSGEPLAFATTYNPVAIVAGANTPNLGYFYGYAKTFKTTISPATVSQGAPTDVAVSLFGVDAGGAMIPESNVFGPNGLLVTAQAGVKSGPYSTKSIDRSGGYGIFVADFHYDGRLAGTETFRFRGSRKDAGVTYGTVALTMSKGLAGVAQIAVYNPTFPDGPQDSVLLFTADANGDVSPWRTYHLQAPAFSMDDSGAFWAGPFSTIAYKGGKRWLERYDNSGASSALVEPVPATQTFVAAAADAQQSVYAVQGEMAYSYPAGYRCPAHKPILAVYSAAGSYKKVVRSINLGSATCAATAVAVDKSGNSYVDRSFDVIDEYAPKVNGDAPPIRTLPYDAYSIAVDAAGNVYEPGYFPNQPYCNACSVLREFYVGSTNPVLVLPAVRITAAAFDARGNLYAVVETPQGSVSQTYAVEVFPPGATMPSRIIAGPNTGLTNPRSIVVAP